MAGNRRSTGGQPINSDSAMAGVLALLVDARESRVADDKGAVKTEVLLSAAGLSVEDIAAVTRKNTGAVRKTIERSRAT